MLTDEECDEIIIEMANNGDYLTRDCVRLCATILEFPEFIDFDLEREYGK